MSNESCLLSLVLQFVNRFLVCDFSFKLSLLVKSLKNFKNYRSVESHCTVLCEQNFKLFFDILK